MTLYSTEDAEEMVEYVAHALKQTSRESSILLYATDIRSASTEDDRFGRPVFLLLRNAEVEGRTKANPKMPGD